MIYCKLILFARNVYCVNSPGREDEKIQSLPMIAVYFKVRSEILKKKIIKYIGAENAM